MLFKESPFFNSQHNKSERFSSVSNKSYTNQIEDRAIANCSRIRNNLCVDPSDQSDYYSGTGKNRKENHSLSVDVMLVE